MANTTNFGWETPDDTDLVKDGALAMRTLGNAIDTSLVDLKGGTTGQVLSKNTNTDMDFTWVTPNDADAIQNSIVDAKGDLISATADNTPARLASSGVNGQVLTIDTTTSTGLKWAAPAAGGGYTLINTGGTTLSGATTSITSIPGDYVDLYILVINFRPATDNQPLRLQINNQTGSVYIRGYGGAFGDTNWQLAPSADNGTSNGLSFGHIRGYTQNTWKFWLAYGVGNDSTTTTNAAAGGFAGQANITAAVTSLQFFCDSGNLTSGTVYVYGVK